MFKICSKCKVKKPLTEFVKSNQNKDGRTYDCKPCRAKTNRLYKEANKQKVKEYHDKYVQKNPNYYKNKHLVRAFGITLVEFNLLSKRQNHVCAICGKKELTKNMSLAVDHCHATDKIRGLLCIKCNTALGSFNDSIDLLNSAIKYLNKDNNQTPLKGTNENC